MLGCGLPTYIKAIFDLIDLIWYGVHEYSYPVQTR